MAVFVLLASHLPLHLYALNPKIPKAKPYTQLTEAFEPTNRLLCPAPLGLAGRVGSKSRAGAGQGPHRAAATSIAIAFPAFSTLSLCVRDININIDIGLDTDKDIRI